MGQISDVMLYQNVQHRETLTKDMSKDRGFVISESSITIFEENTPQHLSCRSSIRLLNFLIHAPCNAILQRECDYAYTYCAYFFCITFQSLV